MRVPSRIQSGDPDMIHHQAIRHVTGDGVARDWTEASRLFAVAAAGGHEGALLAQASLIALGARAAADWPGAVALLARGVESGPAAAENLALIRQMDLKPDGGPAQPPVVTLVTFSPRVWIAERLVTPAECAHVRALAAPLLRPSLVTDPRSGELRAHPIRTSDGGIIGPIQQDLVIHAINRRIAAATGTRIEEGEPLAVLRYRPGQQYRLHHDCLPGEANQRVLTAIVYLNDGFEGGGTAFEALGRTFTPNIGDAIIFANTTADGRPDQNSRHAGTPVTRGEKWVATRWIRQTRFDPWGLYD